MKNCKRKSITLEENNRNSSGVAQWTTAEIHTIISLVREYPQLYDRKHPDYKHSLKKELAWEQIATIISPKTALQCKRKWNTLRIQQRRYYTSEQKRKGPPKKITWHCYDLLRFLIPHMEWINTNTDTEDQYEEEILDDQQDSSESVEETKPFYRINSKMQVVDDEQEVDDDINTTTHTYLTNIEPQQSPNNIETISSSNETPTIQSVVEQQHHLHQEIIEKNSSSVYNHDTSSTHIAQTSNPITNAYSNKPIIRRSFIQSPTSVSSQYSSVDQLSYYSQPAENRQKHLSQQHQSIINGNINNTGGDHSMSINYFLMDIQLQMEKLNDFAQIELKIEIQKLLLEKLRCQNNLR